jgi:hypothetical protein
MARKSSARHRQYPEPASALKAPCSKRDCSIPKFSPRWPRRVIFLKCWSPTGISPVAGNRGPNAHVVHLNLTPGTLDAVTVLDTLLDDPKRPWKSAAFSQYPRNAGKTGAGELMGYTMRDDRYRFTVWASKTDHSKVDATELCDHQTDPQENVNIAKDPANAELVEKLMEQWKEGWQSAKPTVATKS